MLLQASGLRLTKDDARSVGNLGEFSPGVRVDQKEPIVLVVRDGRSLEGDVGD